MQDAATKKWTLFGVRISVQLLMGIKSMKKIDMKDGYIIYPSDWVVLEGVLRAILKIAHVQVL